MKEERIIRMPSADDIPPVAILADGGYPAGAVAAAMLRRAEKVVCCDGAAAAFAGRGGVPYAVVGDCDSLTEELKERFAPVLHCDPDQETNDLTKAVGYCLREGFGRLTILGATGKREDHTVANISLLTDYGTKAEVRMVSDFGVFDPIYGETCFESFPGQDVSIFTFSPVTLVTTGEGLRYPLRSAGLGGWWKGSLNESLAERFTVIVTGPAVVFRVFPEPV